MIRATCLLLAAVSFTAVARADGLACTLADLDAHQSPPDRVQACLASGDFAGADPIKLQTALIDALDAAALRATLAPNDREVAVAEGSVKRLDELHLARPADRSTLYATYLEVGQLDHAKTMVQLGATPALSHIRFPELRPLRADERKPAAYWRLTPDGQALAEHGVDLSVGRHLVIVSSPGCHFCNDAAGWVEGNAAFKAAFKRYALWIDRPDGNFDARYYAQWNAAHPASPMNTVLDIRGWPMPRAWATPQFFFMADGRVVETVTGWMAASPERLRSGFKSIRVDLPAPRTVPAVAPVDDEARAELRDRHRIDLVLAPIHDAAQLSTYLATHDISQTPLGKLSEGGRQRFLRELRFGPSGGLASFSIADVDADLTVSQAFDLLSLFGAQSEISVFADARVESDRDRQLVAILVPGVTPAPR